MGMFFKRAKATDRDVSVFLSRRRREKAGIFWGLSFGLNHGPGEMKKKFHGVKIME